MSGILNVTGSECQGEFLRLDLCDLLRLQLLRHVLLAVGDRLVQVNTDSAAGVLDFGHGALSGLQRLKIIAAGRLGLTHCEEVLRSSKRMT